MQIQAIKRRLYSSPKKIFLRGKNSKPYLSGDLFAMESDIYLYDPSFPKTQPSAREVSEARVIFCPSHELERAMDEYSKSINAKVLILGNSDRDFDVEPKSLPRQIKKIFCQNLMFQDSRFQVLPIGIENLRLAQNGNPNYIEGNSISEKKNICLVGPFSPTHDERSFFFSNTTTAAEIRILEKRLSPKKYSDIAKKYRFIACPRGNGMDTHRFWETFYRAGIPIVLESIWAKSIKQLGFKFATLETWDFEQIKNVLHDKSFAHVENYNQPFLWWPYWEREIKKNL